jgi:DNA-binding NtrC family response regulator
MKSSSILIVDDEPSYLILLKEFLVSEGFENIITESDPFNVTNLINSFEIDLILSDVYMPGMNGLELLETISISHPQIPVIMVTGVDKIDVALSAIKLGAYDYITKPPDTDRLLLTIKRALDQRLLELEINSLRRSERKKEFYKSDFSDIITESPLMYKVFELVEIFAPTSETVLVVGETGTGKDLIAKKIHDLSPRKNAPFVVVNMASISTSLFESELFGHERGAFTGAAGEKKGYFEAANGGTIFLDEIGELPKELQGKLLRAIQYSEIYRLGSSVPIKLDIRIIAATNKDLLEAVNKKEFRADLFYRLNRCYIKLPPLRNRGEDIIHLANYFLIIGNRTYNKDVAGFSDKVLAKIRNYNFSGNIRELENIIFSAVAKTPANELIKEIDIADREVFAGESDIPERQLVSIEEAVKAHIKFVLKSTNNNYTQAAHILGVSERTLYRKIKEIKKANPPLNN